MKTIEIIGFKRANLGKRDAKLLRREANAPGVLYGAKEQIHFYTPMSLLKDLVYVSDAHFVNLNIEGEEYKCILQDIQFHPVSEMILHIDMLQISDERQIKMDIPVVVTGNSPGVAKGGFLSVKLRKLPVIAYPKDMPEAIKVDISNLELAQMVRVKDIEAKDFKILKPSGVPIVSIELSRALRSAATKDSKADKADKKAEKK